MTAFLVRRYNAGKPELELRRVEAETDIEAAERICGGPLSAGPRPMAFCRAEVRLQSTPERRTFFYSSDDKGPVNAPIPSTMDGEKIAGGFKVIDANGKRPRLAKASFDQGRIGVFAKRREPSVRAA
jgi:hypothetical protein